MGNSARPVILVVDDNVENLKVIASTLDRYGFSAAVAMNADECFSFLSREKPELILMDVMMPGTDGFDLCAQLKRSPAYKEIPVIFLTARADSEDAVRGLQAGAVDYVVKPFNPAELLARVRTHVELKHAREEIKTLRGVLPVCANCKSIRDEDGVWLSFEKYLHRHTEAELSHGMCPVCVRKLYPAIADKVLGVAGRNRGT